MTIAAGICAAWIAAAQSMSPGPPAPSPDGPGPDSAATRPEAPDASACPDEPPPPPEKPPLPLPAPAPAAPSPPSLRIPTGPDLVRRNSLRAAGVVLLAVPIVGELTWWRNEQSQRFHFTRENWFGRDTYAGGADKVSHVVGGYIFAREFAWQLEKFGNSPARSRAYATAMTALGGILVEGGDGFSIYGFSWEDILSNVVGAGFAAGIGAGKLDDLLGIRYGNVRTEIPPPCCRATAYGGDYSEEVFSFDLKLGSALKRAGIANPGPARFLLLSLTYGSKGYRFSPVENRERNVGVDVGLNMVEVLKALGVREDTWWGLPILKFFNYYRLEYTAGGWRYDFNHGRWSGFGTGGKFDPGRVIYQ